MRTLVSFVVLGMALGASAQGTFCNASANVVIFSNYDGGALTINVDQDIPDLHIGIVSYEFAIISITGPFVSNVVAVEWAGYNGNNDHCGTGAVTQSTLIGGVTSGISDIVVMPPSTLANSNGNSIIICSYSCDISTQQGGCNTVDQVAHYFLDQWNGTLLFHLTQYGCWGGVYDISDGGNCCVGWVSTAVPESGSMVPLRPFPMPASDVLQTGIAGVFDVLDLSGRCVAGLTARGPVIDVSGWPVGAYLLRERSSGAVAPIIVAR